ncbi:MAG: hypothetical protein E3K36_14305 [Candidatus Brocadia sp.]|nr:hypothetical protein [Candidatus Brocadia sp.]
MRNDGLYIFVAANQTTTRVNKLNKHTCTCHCEADSLKQY